MKCSEDFSNRVSNITKYIDHMKFAAFIIVHMFVCFVDGKGKGRVHRCTGTEVLYRPYGTWGEVEV